MPPDQDDTRYRPAGAPGAMPLVGRDEELAFLREARRARPALGTVVAGEQGVGKSRLVGDAATEARAERWQVEWVDGAAASAAVPLSAVAHLAPPGAVTSGDPLQTMMAVQEHLAKRAARHRLVLAVDDGHLLDDASLALLRRAAGIPNLHILVTVRSDELVPAPLTGLWKDGHAHRLELQPLSRDETYHLGSQLMGTAAPEALNRLWNQSLGNPLFVRELTLAGERDGTGPAATADPPPGASARAARSRRLAEVVQIRVGALDREQRRTLEILTVAGPLGLDVLSGMVPGGDIDGLVDRGLVAVRDDEPRPVAMLGHPIYGVVLEADMTGSRTRQLRSEVLEHLEKVDAAGTLAPRDAVRLITLRLDLGMEVETPELLAAVRYVQAAYPRALAERLTTGVGPVDEATAAVASGDTHTLPSSDDLAVAERLARQAWDAEGTLAAGLALVALLVARKQVDEATRLVGTLEGRASTEQERVPVALARASLAYWVLDRPGQAEEVLRAAETVATRKGELARLRRARAGIALNCGRVREAADLAGSLLDPAGSPGPPDAEAVMAASTAAAARALQGDAAAAVDLVSRFLPHAQERAGELPEVLAQLMLARIFAARVLGNLDEAEWFARACYEPAVESGSTAGMATFAGALGQVTLDKGLPVTAIRRLREAEVLLRERDTFGYRPFVLANLAAAMAQLDDPEGAGEACELASAAGGENRFFAPEIVLARAWASAADGRLAGAATTARAAASGAEAAGLHAFEATALHAAVRFGRPGEVAERLQELATTLDSPLIDAYAAHARAAATGDAGGLMSASTAFEQLGANLLAVEAAAHAAAEHDRVGRRREASRASSRVEQLGVRVEGARSPSLQLATRPPVLTTREHEVALLAANGLTSKEIADRLVVSPRTVESHLYRAFAKLGVTDRSELAGVLDSSTATAGRP